LARALFCQPGLDELRPKADVSSYQTQITFVKDRPGHDRRYAIDVSSVGWKALWCGAEHKIKLLLKSFIWSL